MYWIIKKKKTVHIHCGGLKNWTRVVILHLKPTKIKCTTYTVTVILHWIGSNVVLLHTSAVNFTDIAKSRNRYTTYTTYIYCDVVIRPS